MARIVRTILDQFDVTCDVVFPPLKQRAVSKLKKMLSPFRSMGRLLMEWMVIRSSDFQGAKRNLPATPIVLIDTFAIPGHVQSDRYYPGLYTLAGEQRNRIRFVPQFLEMSLGQLLTAVRQLRERPQKYLIKEDYISWLDIFWCFGHWYRLKKIHLENTVYQGIEVSTLIQDELASRIAYRCALRGLLNYRFSRALKQNGVAVDQSIDWFENHPLDRGWNAGFTTFFPEIKTIGYTGFFPAGQSYRPTTEEYQAGILPNTHMLIGEGYVADMKEFFPDCLVKLGPALRYTDLPTIRVAKDKVSSIGASSILVALPYYRSMCLAVLNTITELAQNNPDWKFVIKAHPAQPLETLGFYDPLHGKGLGKDQSKDMRKNRLDNIQVSEDSISTLLQDSIAMIAGAQASTIVEAAAVGVPTIIISDKTNSEEIAIPSVLSEQLYEVCGSVSGAQQAIDGILRQILVDRDNMVAMAKDFRAKCFYPVSTHSVEAMLFNRT